MTGALLFLGIVSWETMKIPFFFFFVVPCLFTLAFTKLGITRKTVFSAGTAAGVAVSLVVMFVNVWFLQMLFGAEAVSQSVTRYDSLLVAVLFAIYEETLFLSVVSFVLAAGLPWGYAVLFSDILFVWLHALRYPATWFFDLFLLVGRTVMTAALVMTRNSDVSMTTHVLYNLIASLGGS
jgi:hypothetical protein